MDEDEKEQHLVRYHPEVIREREERTKDWIKQMRHCLEYTPEKAQEVAEQAMQDMKYYSDDLAPALLRLSAEASRRCCRE